MDLKRKLKYKFLDIIKNRKKGFEFLLYNISGNVFTFILNFSLPFFLTADGYGYFALIFSIFNLGAAFFTFGFDATIIKFSIEKSTRGILLKNCFIAWIILTLISLIFLILFSYLITKLDIFEISFFSLIQVLFASSLISFQRIVLSYYIGTEEIKKYGLIFLFNKIIQFLLFLLTSIYANNILILSLFPKLLLIQSVLVLFVVLFIERNKILNIHSSKSEVHRLIKFTLPLSINTFGNFGYSYGFNVIVSPFLSLSQLGILNIFNQLSSIASMTINALNNGYLPLFYRELASKSKNAISFYFKYIAQNSIPIIIVVFSIGIIYKYLSFETDSDYSFITLLIYCIGIFLYSFKSIGSGILIMRGETMRISLITVITSSFNILIAIVITQHFNFFGCVISLSLGYIIQVLAFNYISLKLYFTEK